MPPAARTACSRATLRPATSASSRDADLRKAATAPPADGPKRSGVVTAAPLTEATRARADELSLVSTQILRKVVKPDGKVEFERPKAAARKDKSGGFNPYDNN